MVVRENRSEGPTGASGKFDQSSFSTARASLLEIQLAVRFLRNNPS